MNSLRKTLLLGLFCCFACGNSTEEKTSDSFMLKLIWKCAKSEDVGNCLKLKAAKYLDELVRMKEPLVITEYLSLAKDPKVSEHHLRGLNDSEADVNVGKSEEGKGEYLDRLIWQKLVSLFTTRTIQLNLSSHMFEGRGKEDKIFKKGHGFFLMAAMMGGMMMKMALGKIALIAGKALVLGKIALVLSLILALKKFASQGSGGPPEVVLTSSELGGGRNFADDSFWSEDGTHLAYSAHKPETPNKL